MKSRMTPNPRCQPPQQIQKGGMKIGAPEARHWLPVSSKDSNKTDLLHLGPGHGRRVVCSIGCEKKNEVHLHVLTAAIRVPTKRKPRCNQGSIIIGARRLGKLAEESEDNEGGHWKSKSRRHRTRMPSLVKTYNGSRDSEDNLKLFQAAAKKERFENSIQGKLSLTNKTHQGSGEDTSYQANRWRIYEGLYGKIQSRNPGRGRSTGMHEDLRIHARVTTSFLQGEVAAFSHSRKKAHAPWKQLEGGNKPNFKKGFKNKQRSDRKPDRFSLLTKTPKEIFALEKGKFKAPPPMVTPAEKRDPNKYCEFHADTRHNMDECMQLRKQIDEMIKSGKLSQFIKELKQNDKPKAPK
ncbi:hypothetical protein Tco_0680239 [Tanacetum coccineum]|uniref:Reverse transcriptase domain-containing protein n=1 Tax=Tanacetum coccineum TaxID=301880 RepID=A0ABQ4XKV4_9ASTR